MAVSVENQEAVKVARSRSNQLLTIPYHPEAVKRLKRVDGVEFDAAKGRWNLPLSLGDVGDKAIDDVKRIFDQDTKDHASIEQDAISAGNALLRLNETPEAVVRVSDYHDRSRAVTGEIIAANGGYAAQLTGFGKDDGNAFVTLHRQSELARTLFKGERISIEYGDKGRAQVTNLAPDFEKSMGKTLDGVKVTLEGKNFCIEFAYNPDMIKRLRRVDGVEYDRTANASFVPVEKQSFVARAVSEMRDIFLKTGQEIDGMTQTAEERLSGAKPALAYKGPEAPAMSGPIVAVGEYMVLQHVGKGDFRMHYKSELDKVPEVGQSIRIKYEAGKGMTQATSKGKEVGYGR